MKYFLLVLLLIILIGWPLESQTISAKYYVVTAVDGQGDESAYSNEVSCPVTAAKPHCVLTWVASTSTGVTGYNVYRSTISGTGYARMNLAPVSGLTYTDLVQPPNPPTGLTGVTN